MKTKFNLPQKVIFCSKCVMSNQRPSSIPEFYHTKNRKGAKYLEIKKKTILFVLRVFKMKKKKR